MGLRKKFLDQVKTTFGRASTRGQRPLENDGSPDLPIASGETPGVRTRISRPDSSRDGNGRGIQTMKARSTESGDNNAAPTASNSDGNRIIGKAENVAVVNSLGELDQKRQQPMDRRYQNDQRDFDNVEQVRDIGGISPSTSEIHSHSAAVGDATDLLFLSGRSPLGHYPYRSTEFGGVTNSGISFGQGPVNVSNVNTGNTTTVTGTLIQNNAPSERIRPGLELLLKRVAPSAFHNSAQRSDPPRCHPDTRVAIQKRIYDWILMDVLVRQAWIMWMHGAAGAGKSAIMQSVAELCEKAQIPLASFFFVRTDEDSADSGRNLYDDRGHPLIFDQSLESQLQDLFIQPILRFQQYFKGSFVVFIDGLDECIERARQSELIKLLGIICGSKIPVIFLLASRREPQIEAEFVRKPTCNVLQILPLDNSDVERTSEDIRRFVVDKFSDIRETHLLKHHIPIDWPPSSVVKEIVDKSSGQFIFASVVVKYISSPRANPVHQLEVLRGIRLRGPSSQNPFAHLDALYQHIFSQVEALDKVFDIVALVFLLGSNWIISSIRNLLLLEPGELDVLFTDLTPVILCESDTKSYAELKFLHASLPDFLLDQTRSGKYHIDLDYHRTKLLCMLLERPPILDSLWLANNLELVKDREGTRLNAINILLQKTQASEQLRSAFMQFNSTFYTETFFYFSNRHRFGPDILRNMLQLDFSDQGKAYRHVMNMFAAEYAKYWSSFSDSEKAQVKEISPDLVNRINQIRKQAT